MPNSFEYLSPEYIDHELATRDISNSELLRSGAKYENGALVLTDEQLENIANNQEDFFELPIVKVVSDAISDIEDSMSAPIESVVSDAENKARLSLDVSNMLVPYSSMFSDKIPPADTNERSLFGKLKTQPKFVPEWTAKRTTGNSDVTFKFTLKYIPGEEDNTVDAAYIEMTNNPDNVYADKMAMALTYNNGRIRSIQLANINLKQQLQQDMLGMRSYPWDSDTDNKLGVFLESACDSGSMEIDVSGDSPMIILNREFRQDSRYGEYRYDPKLNVFKLSGSRKYSSLRGGGLSRLDTISKEEFLGILNATLELIPTKQA
jgi:hypothetical protein